MVGVSGCYVECDLGILEPVVLGQARHVKLLDKEPGPVGAEAEPRDEGDEAHDGEEGQEDRADDFGDLGGEAVLDALHVVTGRVVALHGLWVLVWAHNVVNRYVVVVAVHFSVCAMWEMN